jgi:O-acetyl-ADP-ribose deacetylase (regulator of RNase III)
VIHVVVDDLAFVPADAVVRPATSTLEPASSAVRHLEQVGGAAFWQQLRVQKALDVGAAVVTSSGDLEAEFVIHAVVRSDTEDVSSAGVRRSMLSVLQRAADWELARISTPVLGTGPGNLSLEDAAGIMVDVLASALRGAAYPKDVCIVVESDDDRAIVEACLRSRILK